MSLKFVFETDPVETHVQCFYSMIMANEKLDSNRFLISGLFFSEDNLEPMEDLNVIELLVDAIKMHKKVSKHS